MTEGLPEHAFHLRLDSAAPAEIDAGTPVALAIAVLASCECRSHTWSFVVVESGAVRRSGVVEASSVAHEGIVEIVLEAPAVVGEFRWTLVLTALDTVDDAHASACVPMAFRTRPHIASLAAWGHPSAVVRGETFSVNVGATCSAACQLEGTTVGIHDEHGSLLSTGRLGGQAWPGTKALYWTAVELRAPDRGGPHAWSARVAASTAGSSPPHGSGSCGFSFSTVGPPDHRVLVTVVAKGSGQPLAAAHVSLGVYHADTDASGMASFDVPSGSHDLSVCKTGYVVPATRVEVDAHATVRIEADTAPMENFDRYWKG